MVHRHDAFIEGFEGEPAVLESLRNREQVLLECGPPQALDQG